MYVILICRLVLGITEGIYWPQQSRFASDWFSDKERTQANSIIQYYGQFLALGLGFMIFVSAGCCLRLAKCFYYHWCDRHCCCGSTLYNNAKKTGRSALLSCAGANREKLNLPWNRWAEPPSYSLFLPTSLKGCCSGELRYGSPWLSILSAIPDSVKHWSVLCLI
ncbi:Vesicular glutamate transporter 3 VGluT3, Solute carrier family 17 member 8 [Salmonella enterica subsp. enterica]|uniref:Vesicular glutamate transporter 3 VGluT3, Solute carrier family 17 member 8 n=1 Tax=Salmonella enterica I TaxID=59201 RepID=A0A3S4HSS6_SALET|nr:Vesicular glutamate transporter 3 VGluT3, Solute carrier family 17 member 8 [Salmonella enterica subsp. enterica]